MRILYEDEDQIVVHKPAGVATQTAKLGQKDLVSEVKNHISKAQGIINPYAGVINRLDQPVEGIVLFAKNTKAAAVLSEQMQSGSMKKWYQAVIFGHMEKPQDTLFDYMEKDGRSNTSRVVSDITKDAKKAELKYSVLATIGKTQLLEIELLTGRHHQIRVQFSSRNHPLIGDNKYGSQESLSLSREMNVRVPALCAYRLAWKHPKTKKEMQISAESENPIIKGLCNCI